MDAHRMTAHPSPVVVALLGALTALVLVLVVLHIVALATNSSRRGTGAAHNSVRDPLLTTPSLTTLRQEVEAHRREVAALTADVQEVAQVVRALAPSPEPSPSPHPQEDVPPTPLTGP